ncbi:hypothetical protein MASR1M45_21080 [Candidatus Kapaibacterium sp.]
MCYNNPETPILRNPIVLDNIQVLLNVIISKLFNVYTKNVKIFELCNTQK